MSLTGSHMWVHVGHMWVTRHSHVIAEPHMCLTCDNCSSHVDKRVKLEQHTWDTCEHMCTHVGHMWIQCDFSVGYVYFILSMGDSTVVTLHVYLISVTQLMLASASVYN